MGRGGGGYSDIYFHKYVGSDPFFLGGGGGGVKINLFGGMLNIPDIFGGKQ